jgi:hypothetical protein
MHQHSVLHHGDQVHVHVPGLLSTPLGDGQVVGFYSNEPRRVVVALPSGEELVALESDVSLI